jgi:AhpC/TSA antioxidant enzyme
LCQEFILQWNKRLDELESLGIKLILVSIGKPEIGSQLVEHLNVPRMSTRLFVDMNADLYKDLDLNKGVKETFLSPGTPFSFLDRFTRKDGMKELMEVLSKWNKGTSRGSVLLERIIFGECDRFCID